MFYKKAGLFCINLFTAISLSHAGPVERLLQQQKEARIPLIAAKSIHTERFNQLIDHNAPEAGRFAQRYYVDESYSISNESPVFFYICGEAACSKRYLNGAIREYAKKFHAKLVALEHRYYGESMPFKSLSSQDLHLLTTEAALDDLAYFQRNMVREKNWSGKWVAFGGSYPGSLAAYYRLKFPYLVAGALASSAPVMAKEDFVEYDAHVTHVAGTQCANQIREVVTLVETSINDAEQLKAIKALFDATAVVSSIDFLYLIADTAAGAVQYGQRDDFCAALAKAKTPLEGYANYAKKMYQELHVTAVELTAQGAMSEKPEEYKNNVGMRQWYYQSCREYGYWQNAHPDASLSTRSALINLNYHHQVCDRLFGLKKPAQTQELNNTFYYPLMDILTSNIYFTNGEYDPWSTLSLAEKNANAINPKLNYQLINGAAHCDDLHASSMLDSDSLVHSRKIMEGLLSKWLEL